MRKFGFLFVMAVALMTLASSTCKKRPVAPVELPDQEAQIKGATKGQFSMTFKYNTVAGPVVPFSNWVLATSMEKMLANDPSGWVDYGTSGLSGMDTTKQLEPGQYFLLGYGDWNGDSIGAIVVDDPVKLQAGTKPKSVVVPLKF